jgi:SAM-dependent methyltransferase
MDPAAYLEMDETETTHWWFLARRAILSRMIESLDLPPNAKILEIGCGTGGNLDMLAGFGEVHAIEMDANARAIISRKTNDRYDVRAGHLPDAIPFRDRCFDLICMFDVLEHIDRDAESLAALKPLLKENGRILLTVPAYQWLWSAHDEFLHHQRRYSAADLRGKIESAGLHALKMSHYNAILFPLAAVARLKDKLLGNTKISGTAVLSAPVNRLLKHIFGAERFFLRYLNFPFGVSLLCILHSEKGE